METWKTKRKRGKDYEQGAQIDISKFTQLKEEVLGAVSIVNYSFNHLGFRIKAKRLIEEKLFSSTNPLGYIMLH